MSKTSPTLQEYYKFKDSFVPIFDEIHKGSGLNEWFDFVEDRWYRIIEDKDTIETLINVEHFILSTAYQDESLRAIMMFDFEIHLWKFLVYEYLDRWYT